MPVSVLLNRLPTASRLRQESDLPTPAQAALGALLDGLAEKSPTTAITAVDKHLEWLKNTAPGEADAMWEEALPCLLNAVLRSDACSDHICEKLFEVCRENESLRPQIEQHAHGAWQFITSYRRDHDDGAPPSHALPAKAPLSDTVAGFRFTSAVEILHLAGSHAMNHGTLDDQLAVYHTLAKDHIAFLAEDDLAPSLSGEAGASVQSTDAQQAIALKAQQNFPWNPAREVGYVEIDSFMHREGFNPLSKAHADDPIAPPSFTSHDGAEITITPNQVLESLKSANFCTSTDDIYQHASAPGVSVVPLLFESHWSLLVIDTADNSAAIFDSNLSSEPDVSDTLTSPNPRRQVAYDALRKNLSAIGIQETSILGGSLQSDTPNACGPLILHMARQLVTMDSGRRKEELEKIVEKIHADTIATKQHRVDQLRREMLGAMFHFTRGI